MEQLRISGWVLAILGAFAIGGGGLLTTYGWNCLNRFSQMKSVIRAVAHEWKINNALVTKEVLFNVTNDETLGSYRLYPRFKTSALSNALTSGLFDPSNPKHRILLRSIVDYEMTLSDVNSRLDVSDNIVISTMDRLVVAKHRRNVPESGGFKSFLARHRAMEQLLRRDYKWALDEKLLD